VFFSEHSVVIRPATWRPAVSLSTVID